MLSRFDDYPVHQAPGPVAVPATSDRDAYDRYWFNGFPSDGSWYLGVAMGRYPHRGVIDAAVSVVADGTQHCTFASGRAPREPTDTRVGPIRIEIVEPMLELRLVIDDDGSRDAVSGELTFSARTSAVEEGRQTLRRRGRAVLDVTRFAQYGRWEGVLSTPDGDVVVSPGDVRATKDRSWGVRRVGEPPTGGAPDAEMPQFWFLWSPVHWSDRCTHVGLFEDGMGRRIHTDAAVTPSYDSAAAVPGPVDEATREMVSVQRRINWASGTRRAARADVGLVDESGVRLDIDLEPLLLFQMKGIGYGHPRWRHGAWLGEQETGHESFRPADLDPLALENLHVQQLVRASSDGDTGMGALEQIVVGPHRGDGFSGLADGAA
jgi:hypothetical protein